MSGEEKSNLVDQVTSDNETTENQEFDIKGFLGEETNEKTEYTSDSEESPESSKEEEVIDAESWDNIIVEDDEEEETEETTDEPEEDWDIEEEEREDEESTEDSEESNESNELDWELVGKEFNLDVSSKEEFVQMVNQVMSSNKPEPTNENISALNDLLKLNDRELLSAEMKAEDMDEFDIEDSLDKMEDSGMLKMKAKSVRRQLSNAVKKEKSKMKSEKEESEREKAERFHQNKKDLQDHLKSVDKYFGGNVSQKEKKSLYKYIISGKFNDDIYANHENVSEIAWMWKNKAKIKKILFSEGFEQGKAHIFNGITSPSTNRSSKPNLKLKTGEFDLGEFMKEN